MRGCGRSTSLCAPPAASSTSRTWARSRPRVPGRCDLLQRLLSNDVSKLEVGGAQYSVLCREDGGILDDLFTYRLADDRYLTVTNAANHDKDFAWFADHAGEFDADVIDAIDRYAMLAVQGPDARGIVAGLASAELPARMHTAVMDLAGAETLVCGTGYTGEDGVELLPPADAATDVWDALLAAGAKPTGLGARDTLRLEVCFHLYGNDMDESRNADRGGPRAGAARRRRDSSAPRPSPPLVRAAPSRSLRRSSSRPPASPARGTRWSATTGRSAWSRAGPCRRAWTSGSAWATSPRSCPSREPSWRSTSAASAAPPASNRNPCTERRASNRWPTRAIPEGLRYHPEHDWARIDGDEATFGVTWYAQDALGEVVFYEPPEVGSETTKDQAYAEVESVKAVSDVYAPLSGEITAVNDAVSDSPELVNEDPYGEGWLVRVKLTNPSEVDELLDVAAYRKLLEDE